MDLTKTIQKITKLKKSVNVARREQIANNIVFTNGLAGCGKTMMSPIVGSLDRVELMRYNYHLEHICILHHLGKISEDAATSLIRIYADVDLYNLMMSRETNFRFSDLSSVWRNNGAFRYVKRLFQKGDQHVIPRIEKEQPILHLVTHHLLGVSRVLFKALETRMKFIEVIRHPAYMIKQWYTWMPRAGTDPRLFGIWIDHKGKTLPWFAHEWEDLYMDSNLMDKTIYAIERQWKLGMKTYDALPQNHKDLVLLIPFEKYVTNPDPTMKKMTDLLGTQIVAATRKMMKQQNVPRKMAAEGIGLDIYKHYGWEPPKKGASESDEIKRRRDFVAKEASPEAMKVWDELCMNYERTYL